MRFRPAMLLAVFLLGGPAQAAPRQDSAQELLLEIKVSLFDREWKKARDLARRLQERFPDDRRVPPAIYYEAEALQGLGEAEEALKRFQQALGDPGGINDTLRQQARLSVIDLAVDLWGEGRKAHIGLVLEALSHADKAVRYYAALRLSYIDDKDLAERGVPVLREILRREGDAEIRNRASLALLRIDPRLARPAPPDRSARGRMLRFVVESDGQEVISLALPLSLARALFRSIPDEARRELERNGIRDAEALLDELSRGGASVLEFRSEEGYFKIWIE